MDHVPRSGSKKTRMHVEATSVGGDQNGTSVLRPISAENSPHTPEWSLVSVSPKSPIRLGPQTSPGDSTNEPDWNVLNASPPIQPMDEVTGYDPNRIPASVFGRKPASAVDWSVASNDSLFSLHCGNSFPRDHAFLMGISEEVTSNDEWNDSPSSHHRVTNSNELNKFTASLPIVMESAADSERQSAETTRNSQVKEAAEEVPKSVSMGTTEDNDKKNVPPDSTSRQSTESGNSRGSFAFPILGGGGGTSATVKVVPEKASGGDGTSTSEKSVTEKPQPRQRTAGGAANSVKAKCAKCFSCFSCCPRGC